jgi:hypothetical protein
MISSGGPGHERRILIVWMRAGVQRAGRRLQALECLCETCRAEVINGADLRHKI